MNRKDKADPKAKAPEGEPLEAALPDEELEQVSGGNQVVRVSSSVAKKLDDTRNAVISKL